MKKYFKKSHAHKPKKGKGSYDREKSDEVAEQELADTLKRDRNEEQQRD